MRALRKENNQNIYASSQYIHIKKFGICMVFLQNEIFKGSQKQNDKERNDRNWPEKSISCGNS